MNRSVLLVICDFLLLSILALAKFDTSQTEEPEEMVQQKEQSEAMEEDLIEVLRLSLTAEQAEREELLQQLQTKEQKINTQEDLLSSKDEKLTETMYSLEALKESQIKLKQEQEALTQVQKQLKKDKALALADKQRILKEKQHFLEENEELNAQNQKTIERLSEVEKQRLEMVEQVGELKQQTASSAARLKFLQEELREQQAAVAEYATTQERLEHEKRLVELEKQALATKLEVAATETKVIKQQLLVARADVEASRQNVEQMQQHATQLAAGVSTLAESTDQIREEVKQLQPQSLNSIFDRFKKNRIWLEFTATREGLLGERDKQYTVRTILVTDGINAYAIMHTADTPFSKSGLSVVAGSLHLGGRAYRIAEVAFLSVDPRIVVTSVPLELAESAGVVPFSLALEPLRFPETVLIDSQESYFGESKFKLLSDSDRYMRMPSTVISRLFGEFSPKRSDLVFAKTGEFMGMMVNKNYGVLITSLHYSDVLLIGDRFIEKEGNQILEKQKALINASKY